MRQDNKKYLPIRSKIEMAKGIALILQHLHQGSRTSATPLIDELKMNAVFLEEAIQQDVLKFVEQVEFQYDYDPWHRITPEVKKAADQLLEDLGFNLP